MRINNPKLKRIMRHRRVRANIKGTDQRPRFSVYRSSKHIFLQIIDDNSGKTLLGMSDNVKAAKKLNKSDRSFEIGKKIAEKALTLKIKSVVFDRGGYRYHGRVRRVAEGAREGGLVF